MIEESIGSVLSTTLTTMDRGEILKESTEPMIDNTYKHNKRLKKEAMQALGFASLTGLLSFIKVAASATPVGPIGALASVTAAAIAVRVFNGGKRAITKGDEDEGEGKPERKSLIRTFKDEGLVCAAKAYGELWKDRAKFIISRVIPLNLIRETYRYIVADESKRNMMKRSNTAAIAHEYFNNVGKNKHGKSLLGRTIEYGKKTRDVAMGVALCGTIVSAYAVAEHQWFHEPLTRFAESIGTATKESTSVIAEGLLGHTNEEQTDAFIDSAHDVGATTTEVFAYLAEIATVVKTAKLANSLCHRTMGINPMTSMFGACVAIMASAHDIYSGLKKSISSMLESEKPDEKSRLETYRETKTDRSFMPNDEEGVSQDITPSVGT